MAYLEVVGVQKTFEVEGDAPTIALFSICKIIYLVNRAHSKLSLPLQAPLFRTGS